MIVHGYITHLQRRLKMNDRYRELAREAELLVYNPEGHPTKLMKFAELLIRDCVELNKQELSFVAFEQLMDRYQEHFGIEL